MTAHRWGNLTGLDGEAIVETDNCVHLQDIATVAFQGIRFVDASEGGVDFDKDPSFALHMSGRVNHSTDTVDVVWLTPQEGLALLIGMAFDAADRAGTVEKVAADAQAVFFVERGKRRAAG